MCISNVTKIKNIQNIQVMANQNKYENIKYWINRLGCDGRESCFKHGE